MSEEIETKNLTPEELEEVVRLQGALSEVRYQIGEIESRKFTLLQKESAIRVEVEQVIQAALKRVEWPVGQPYVIRPDGSISAKN